LFGDGAEPPSLSAKARELAQMSLGANNILLPQPVPTKLHSLNVEVRNRHILFFFDNNRDVLPLKSRE